MYRHKTILPLILKVYHIAVETSTPEPSQPENMHKRNVSCHVQTVIGLNDSKAYAGMKTGRQIEFSQTELSALLFVLQTALRKAAFSPKLFCGYFDKRLRDAGTGTAMGSNSVTQPNPIQSNPIQSNPTHHLFNPTHQNQKCLTQPTSQPDQPVQFANINRNKFMP
jgi:hypothetical protein